MAVYSCSFSSEVPSSSWLCRIWGSKNQAPTRKQLAYLRVVVPLYLSQFLTVDAGVPAALQ